MARRFNTGYYISEGFRSVFTHGFMSFAAVCMIVACLLIMGSFTLVAVNLDHMLGDLEAENEFIAYVDENFNEAEARAVRSDLEQIDNISELTFVTREEARDDFLEGREDNELLESLPATVLRNRYRIHVTDIEEMSQTVSMVEAVDGVVKVSAAIEIAQGFVMIRNIATGVAIILISILLVISLFIISNTIRLATFYRREEIAIMKMCGASDAFVCWPFVVEGIILGLSGAVTATLLQWGIYQMLSNLISQSAGMGLVTLLPFAAMLHTILAVFCGTGLAIGVLGSLVAIRRFLQV